jgi:hypothetical protein
MCSRGPRIRRIPYKSGHFLPLFVKKILEFISLGLLCVAEALVTQNALRKWTFFMTFCKKILGFVT